MKGFFMLMSRPAERTHRYGEVYSFEPGPSDMVIFGSLATVKEIIRGTLVSFWDRPRAGPMDPVVGWLEFGLGLLL